MNLYDHLIEVGFVPSPTSNQILPKKKWTTRSLVFFDDPTWNLNGDKYEAVLNDPGFGPEAYEASFLETDVRIRRAGAAFDIYLPDDSNPKTFTIRVDKGQIHLSVTRKKWQAIKVS